MRSATSIAASPGAIPLLGRLAAVSLAEYADDGTGHSATSMAGLAVAVRCSLGGVFLAAGVLGVVASLRTAFDDLIVSGMMALALAAATLARSANVGETVALLSWGLVVAGSRARTGDYAAAVTSEALLPFYAAATVGLVLLTLYAINPRRGEKTWG